MIDSEQRLSYSLNADPSSTQAAMSGQMVQATKRSKRADQMCVRCRSLDFHRISGTYKNSTNMERSKHATVYPLGIVHRGMSQSRCPLCRLFAARLPSSLKASRQDCVIKVFSAVQHHFQYTYKKKPILDTAVLSIGPRNACRWIPKLERKLGVLHLEKKHNDNGLSIRSSPIHPSMIDYKLAKRWIEFCRAHHKGYCNDQLPAVAFNVPGFRLIDCETRQVREHTEEVEYVALSYVWGLGSHASTRALPNPASRVIEDAIVVTRELGFRYLWIDRYCVSQLDTPESQLQISSMDRIYADAVLTIVAVAGEGPNYGLPGVSRRHRYIHPTASIGDFHLVPSLRPPRDIVRASKWASRGWTFQEAKLSRRTLFFMDEQMVFECACMTCEESIHVPLTTLNTRPHKNTGGEFSTTRIFPPNGPGSSLKNIQNSITEYTSRTLTKDSDNLNAILGIFNSFRSQPPRQRATPRKATSTTEQTQKLIQLHHLWGIPLLPSSVMEDPILRHSSLEVRFCSMLAWRSKTASTRSTQFPSWSWAGWKLPKETYLPRSSEDWMMHMIFADSYPLLVEPVKIWLDLGADGLLALEGLEEHSDCRGVLEKASNTLIIQGHIRTFRFCLTGHKDFPLKPIDSRTYVRFWPDIEMDQDELKQFVEQEWEAINITWSVVCIFYLVVKRVGAVYERIGIIGGTVAGIVRGEIPRCIQSFTDGKRIFLQ
jgi:hypothetical protein